MINILKANELPPGSMMMGRQGRALNGYELATGIVAMVRHRVGEAGGDEARRQLDNTWWPSLHLTFPRAQLEWCDSVNEDRTKGIWLRVLLGAGKEWLFQYLDESADIRELQKLGPFATPDDMREALGLPRIAQFRTPGGGVVTAELPTAHLRQREKSIDEILGQLPEVPQLIAKPEDSSIPEPLATVDMEVVKKEANEAVDRLLAGSTPKEAGKATGGFVSDFTQRFTVDDAKYDVGVDLAKEELLAEPPVVDTTPAPAKPVAAPVKAGLRKAAAKGGRK